MVTNYNSDTTKEVLQAGKLQQSIEKIPNEFSDKIVYVAETNPKLLRTIRVVKRGVATNATSATIVALDANKDFYLVGFNLNLIKDATATSTGTSINIALDGVSQPIVTIATLTLTAQTANISQSLPFPIKLDRTSSITISNSTNVGNITASGVIFGYYDDVGNA